ncbi:M50 family metallopeptidase [Aneurinibacillus sp. REN35]|uniref:M50 family metallopeptidase n=1 Tax=Aneurinibacillus sp. REN35 TaxID=3237286 RepID=UPI0035278F13
MMLHIHPLFWFMMLGALMLGQFLQVLTLFVIVLLHELGHVAAAWWYGWRVRKVELLPFGGVAEIDEWGNTDPWAEIVVALSGPLVNGLLIVVAWGLLWLDIWSSAWTAFFVYSNMTIGMFNLLPIWPLDGGRVLQTAVSLFLPYRQAMLASIYISLLGSMGLLVWSLSYEPTPHLNGLAISFYLFFSSIVAYRRRHYQFLRFLLARQACLEQGNHAWKERLIRVPPLLSLAQAVNQLKRNSYHLFIINGKSLPHAVFSEEALLAYYFSENRRHSTVEELVR